MKTTKKVLAAALALLLCLVFISGCGTAGAAKNALVGQWRAISDEDVTEMFGAGLEFKKDGKVAINLDFAGLAGVAGAEVNQKELDDALNALGGLVNLKYKVKNDHTLEIEISALFGLASEKHEMEFRIEGDRLYLDGAVYQRVK